MKSNYPWVGHAVGGDFNAQPPSYSVDVSSVNKLIS